MIVSVFGCVIWTKVGGSDATRRLPPIFARLSVSGSFHQAPDDNTQHGCGRHGYHWVAAYRAGKALVERAFAAVDQALLG
ncbi:hypothetical protein [Rosistilla oblonga]|uniref:hypothetical protein n=1 Tax=Rosistilla oblonga TaxID=2527990 RepID=UPI003A971643